MTSDRTDHRRGIIIGIVVVIVLMIIAGEASANQPSASAAESEHLYFLENLIVVIAGFFLLYKGIAHGFSVGANKQQMRDGS